MSSFSGVLKDLNQSQPLQAHHNYIYLRRQFRFNFMYIATIPLFNFMYIATIPLFA